MTKKKAIATLLNQTYDELRDNMNEVGFQVFENLQSILVIRSASFEILKSFIVGVTEVNPELRIQVVTHLRDVPKLNFLSNGNISIIAYKAGGGYHVDSMTDYSETIRATLPDAWVMLCDNELGIGFDNVFEVVHRMANAPLYLYNNDSQVVKVVDLKEHLTNLRLITAILDWSWESSGSH